MHVALRSRVLMFDPVDAVLTFGIEHRPDVGTRPHSPNRCGSVVSVCSATPRW